MNMLKHAFVLLPNCSHTRSRLKSAAVCLRLIGERPALRRKQRRRRPDLSLSPASCGCGPLIGSLRLTRSALAMRLDSKCRFRLAMSCSFRQT